MAATESVDFFASIFDLAGYKILTILFPGLLFVLNRAWETAPLISSEYRKGLRVNEKTASF
jgi:hypothetical protein